MKRFGDGDGAGGDWGVRIQAERAADAPLEQQMLEGDGQSDGERPPHCVSLLFYLADEQVRSAALCCC